ncbi:MAG: Asp23/Gls24 family envelope stress response protein, partial [Candidatus Bipolaricaulis sp.]|nr:Asp23/Gls24 family envelope stress response protein [Candidatus Bipolaricaulis sp.]
DGDVVTVTVRITVVYGVPIRKVAKQVQARIKAEIERMTGLRVSAVNVDVQRVVKADEPGEENPRESTDEWEDTGQI